MQIKTTQIISREDGLPLSVMETIPEREPWCLVQLVHGMSEYKERYLPFMEYLADRGISCIIHDHRGHGQSVRQEGELGYTYGAGGASLVQDTRLVTAYLRKKRGKELPLVLIGHSMGSLVTRAYLKKLFFEIGETACQSGGEDPRRASSQPPDADFEFRPIRCQISQRKKRLCLGLF